MMPRRIRLLGSSLAILVVVFAMTNGRLSGQAGAPMREWRTWGGDLANTKYSPLEQINKDNFSRLEVAWRFKTDALGPRPEFNYETTPLMANGVVYATAGTRRSVVALGRFVRSTVLTAPGPTPGPGGWPPAPPWWPSAWYGRRRTPPCARAPCPAGPA